MERCLQEELVENGVSMPFPQLTQHAASIGISPMPHKWFHHALLLKNNIQYKQSELQKLLNSILVILTSSHSYIANFKDRYIIVIMA